LPAKSTIFLTQSRRYAMMARAFGDESENMMNVPPDLKFVPAAAPQAEAEKVGFRFGKRGTHTSRTMMLAELAAVLAATDSGADRDDYAHAIVEGNCLGKPTVSTRRLTNQRLGELYGLDPRYPIFRILRRLWAVDEPGRALLALLVAMARDPLLLATAPSIISLHPGAEFQRDPVKAALRSVVGERLNDDVISKVVRNVASTWAQSGHLEGRTFKRRRTVRATPATGALALYLGHALGFRGEDLLTSGWMATLDCPPSLATELAIDAKRLGLIDLRMGAGVLELGFQRLDPLTGGF
jgi:hypothetical protein